MTTDTLASVIIPTLQAAHKAFVALGQLSGQKRNQGVQAMAKGLENSFDQILEANTLDLEMSREMAVSDCFLDWLKLTPKRLESAVEI
ncbi:MAG: gamma-glutamyl-phosphate reductase, partial [Microcystaceae cyanobacterium]